MGLGGRYRGIAALAKRTPGRDIAAVGRRHPAVPAQPNGQMLRVLLLRHRAPHHRDTALKAPLKCRPHVLAPGGALPLGATLIANNAGQGPSAWMAAP